MLRRVGYVMMQLQFAASRNPRQIVIADDCFELLKIPVDRVAQPVIRSTEKIFGSMSSSSLWGCFVGFCQSV